MKPENFVTLLVQAYQNNQGIFANKVNAEDLIPPRTNRLEKSLYLFYVIQLDYAVKSQNLYKGATELFQINSLFFTPKYLIKMPRQRLKTYLENYLKPRYINEAIERYKVNSLRLLQEFQGNPQIIFEISESAAEALKLVKSFRGFGPKIGNFFVRTMINVFEYSYSDIDNILPPVDIHDVNIAYLLGFIESKQVSLKNIKITKTLWNNACKKSGASWLMFDKALWLLGSEGNPKTKQEIFELINYH